MKEMNQLVKVAAMAIPLFALVACSSQKHGNVVSSEHSDSTAISQSTDIDNAQQRAQLQQTIEQLQQNNTVYFAFDKYNVSSEYADSLAKQATFLRNNPNIQVVIQGYTDERGTPEYNIALGERRANAVKMYLQGQGVSANQISVISYGKEKPAVLGHNEAAYAKNRRAIIVYPTINP